MNEKIIMSFICELINFYKTLVFSQKEFVISKRIIKVTVDMGICCSGNNQKEVYAGCVEIEFWLKVLMTLIDEKELYQKTSQLCKKSEEIIKLMEGADEN